jgi:hypothetical protein
MLWIEKGGERQIKEEIEAYNPLIPKGNILPFTFMLQYPDENKRKRMLAQLGLPELRSCSPDVNRTYREANLFELIKIQNTSSAC